MDRETNQISLWIIKFCLKVLYPKFNVYVFLVYLAIKYRLLFNRKLFLQSNPTMTRNLLGLYEVQEMPDKMQEILVKESFKHEKFVGDSTNVLIISQENYKRFASENCFYRDGCTIWVSLTPHFSKKKDLKRIADKYNVTNVKEYIKYTLGTNDKHLRRSYVPCDERIVQVTGSTKVPNNIIYVTETELFNIKTNFKIPFEVDDLEIKLKPISNMNYIPTTAASMTLDMILNQFDIGDEFVTNLLTNYFEVPRCVRETDYIGIPLESHFTTNYHYKYLDVIEHCDKLYFKCSKLFSKGKNDKKNNYIQNSSIFIPSFVVKGETELTTGLNFHSMVPKERYIRRYMNEEICSNIEDSMRELCPAGLHIYFEEILAAILPFLIDEEVNPIHTMLPTPLQPIFLLSGLRGSGKTLLAKLSAKYYGMNHLTVDCNDLISSTAKQTESKLHTMIQKAKSSSPAIISLINFESFAVDAENNEDTRIIDFFSSKLRELFENYTKYPIIFIAITEQIELKPNISRIFLEKFHLRKPNKKRRLQMIEWFISVMNLKFCDEGFVPLIKNYEPKDLDNKVIEEEIAHTNVINLCRKIYRKKEVVLDKNIYRILDKIASKTETFSFGDIDTLIHFSLRNSFLEQKKVFMDQKYFPNIFLVRETDFMVALESMRSLQSQNLDAPKIPNVHWEDIGGLDNLKKELLKTIEFPIKYPHLMKNSLLKRSGILLYGPPGCGKTLVAKALSTELNVSFLSVKGPELLNMYIGQSEENVRKVFESARASAPCLVFMDELESLAPKRGALGDSGGASDRVVSQLLAEIDGVVTDGGEGNDVETSRPLVFVMGATNRPDLLEQSLLRPGRLDKLIYVGPYQGNEEKGKVLTALCRSHKISTEVSLTEVVSELPHRCTGADLLHVVSQARTSAVRKLVTLVEKGIVRSTDLTTDILVLCKDDFEEGISTFKPSVTDDEFAHYENLKLHISS